MMETRNANCLYGYVHSLTAAIGQQSRRVAVSLIIAVCGIAGCGQDSPASRSAQTETPQDESITAATLGEQTILSVEDYLAQPEYAAADKARGGRQAQLCRACHTFDAGGAHMIGPNLSGFFGSVAASRDDFDYSAALREADFVWTPRALDAWLAQPGVFLPGNKMTFVGVSNADDRASLIAYLLEATRGTQ